MKIVAGVMGPGAMATQADCDDAFEIGRLIAGEGWVTLTGGRRAGVMEAALRGARAAGGVTIGILPHDDHDGDISPFVDVPILTGLGEARNVINVLTSAVVFVCGASAGTASEIALALRLERPTLLVNPSPASLQFWKTIESPCLYVARSPADAVNQAVALVSVPRR